MNLVVLQCFLKQPNNNLVYLYEIRDTAINKVVSKVEVEKDQLIFNKTFLTKPSEVEISQLKSDDNKYIATFQKKYTRNQ